MKDIKQTELFAAMKACGRYFDDDEIVETIQAMRDDVHDGCDDPEDILHMEGFEPDYIFDIVDL